MTAAPATATRIETLVGCHMQNELHADGRDFFINVSRCIEHPRLTRQITSPRRGGFPDELWLVDGQPVGIREEALAVLNGAPPPIAISVQIAAIENLRKRDPQAIKAVVDGEGNDELDAVLKTLNWCQENAAELRRFRQWMHKEGHHAR